MKAALVQRTAWTIGLVLALSTTALGQTELISLQTAVNELQTVEQPVDESLDAVFAKVITVRALLERVEALASMGDLATLQDLYMQRWLEKQAQALQVLSNILKAVHDTLMTTLNNLKA